MSLLTQLLPKKETKEYFLTLGVEERHIRAATAEVSDEEVVIVGSGESDFGEEVDEIEAVDIAISTAEEKLPPNILVDKVVFALPQVYLEDDDNVKPEYLARLKKIAKELDLKPHGFILYPTAISYYLEKEEGSPPTLLLISVEKKHLTFSLIRVGTLQQSFTSSRGSSVAADFEKILHQFKSEILPSRILLYDGVENLDDIREEMLNFPWHKHSSFLHTPKIEILSSLAIISSIVETAASSFLKKIAISTEEESVSETPETEEKIEKKEVTAALKTPHIPTIAPSSESFGFVKNKDVEEGKEVINKEIINNEEENTENLNNLVIPSAPSFSISRLFSSFKISKPSFSLPEVPSFLTVFLSFLVPAVLLSGLIFSFFWFYPKTTLSLIVYPKTSTQKINVTFTTASSSAENNQNIILVNSLSEEVSGEKTASATGKSKVGEKATGEVTIYNKTLSSKTFPQGTVLQNGNLRFLLDDEIKIASASEMGEGISFGKINAKVTASVIGPESNLSSSSSFTFKDFPETSYSAKNNQSFQGGTSREVSAVSKEDQTKLETVLSDELISKAKQQLLQKLDSNEKLLDPLMEKSVTSKKFSSDVGSEAKEITLNLSIKLSAYSFKDSDLLTLAQNNLSTAPLGFSQDKGKTDIKIEEVKTDKKGNLSALASVTSFFMPVIDTNNIKRELVGKPYSQIDSTLKKIENVAGYKIIEDTALPLLNNRLPFSSQNLNIVVTTR